MNHRWLWLSSNARNEDRTAEGEGMWRRRAWTWAPLRLIDELYCKSPFIYLKDYRWLTMMSAEFQGSPKECFQVWWILLLLLLTTSALTCLEHSPNLWSSLLATPVISILFNLVRTYCYEECRTLFTKHLSSFVSRELIKSNAEHCSRSIFEY